MRIPSGVLKPTALRAVVLSFTFHVFFLAGVMFSFTTKPLKPRPFFVFLGSILQRQDFLASHLDHSLAAPDSRIILEASGGKKDYDAGSFSLSKPSLPKAIRVQGKTSWRSFIPKQFQGEIKASKPQSSADLGLDPQVPRYVPLRLHSSSSTLKGLKADR